MNIIVSKKLFEETKLSININLNDELFYHKQEYSSYPKNVYIISSKDKTKDEYSYNSETMILCV